MLNKQKYFIHNIYTRNIDKNTHRCVLTDKLCTYYSMNKQYVKNSKSLT